MQHAQGHRAAGQDTGTPRFSHGDFTMPTMPTKTTTTLQFDASDLEVLIAALEQADFRDRDQFNVLAYNLSRFRAGLRRLERTP